MLNDHFKNDEPKFRRPGKPVSQKDGVTSVKRYYKEDTSETIKISQIVQTTFRDCFVRIHHEEGETICSVISILSNALRVRLGTDIAVHKEFNLRKIQLNREIVQIPFSQVLRKVVAFKYSQFDHYFIMEIY